MTSPLPLAGGAGGGPVSATGRFEADHPPNDSLGRKAFTRARLIALLVPVLLLAGALGSQYLGGLYPCEMCHWQRWPHYAAVVFAIAAFAWAPAARPLVILAALAILTSGGIGVYHAGVELGVFPGATSCAAGVTAGSTAEALAAILEAPLIRCDEVQFSFAGLSMAGWNALISLTTGATILWLTLKRSR